MFLAQTSYFGGVANSVEAWFFHVPLVPLVCGPCRRVAICFFLLRAFHLAKWLKRSTVLQTTVFLHLSFYHFFPGLESKPFEPQSKLRRGSRRRACKPGRGCARRQGCSLGELVYWIQKKNLRGTTGFGNIFPFTSFYQSGFLEVPFLFWTHCRS